jgi:GntR family transcriptional regulator
MTTVRVRTATRQDAPAVARLHVASFATTYPQHVEPGTSETVELSRLVAAWDERITDANGAVLVADHGSDVCGFAWVSSTPDADDDPRSVGQLRSIHVRATEQGQGVGRQLLAAARDTMRHWGARHATLWVVDDNTSAARVYQRDGWRIDGTTRRERLALPGEDGPLVTVARWRRTLDDDVLRHAGRTEAVSVHETNPTGPMPSIGPDADGLRVPKYWSLKQSLRQRIDGSPAGTALPPERTLSEEFGASRNTVRQALLELAVEGRVVRMQGRGTFVAPPKETVPLRLRSYTEEWQARRRSPGSRLLQRRTEPAEDAVAQQLAIPAGTEVLRIERLRLTDDVPMALEAAYLEAARFAGLGELLTDDVSLYRLLATGWSVEPHTAVETIETVPASPQVANVLHAESGTPMLLLTRTTSDVAERPFEFVRSVYRGDRYRFVTTLARP